MTLLKNPTRPSVKAPGGPPAPAMRGAEQRQIRRGRLAAGALVIVFSALMGWLVIEARGESVDVWVASQELRPGQVISPDVLAIRQIPADGRLSAIATDVELVGRTARLSVPAGSTLIEGHLLPVGDTFENQGVTLVGLALDRGEVPAEISAQDVVRLIPGGDEGTDSTAVVEATVRSVVDADSGDRLVTVEVPAEAADEIARLAADGRLVVTIVGRR